MPRQKQAAAVAAQPLATADFELFCGTKDEADAVHRPLTRARWRGREGSGSCWVLFLVL